MVYRSQRDIKLVSLPYKQNISFNYLQIEDGTDFYTDHSLIKVILSKLKPANLKLVNKKQKTKAKRKLPKITPQRET